LGRVVCDVSSHKFDLASHRLRLGHAGAIGESDQMTLVRNLCTLATDPAMSSDAACNPCRRPRVMHRRDLYQRGVPLRERDCAVRGLARRRFFRFLLPSFAGRRSWVHDGPSQVCSHRMGEPSPFLALGPTCRFARITRHAPIYFRRGKTPCRSKELQGAR
jgi:hypothetical protein